MPKYHKVRFLLKHRLSGRYSLPFNWYSTAGSKPIWKVCNVINLELNNWTASLLFDGSAAYAAVYPGRRCFLLGRVAGFVTTRLHSSVFRHTRSIGCSPCWTPPPGWSTHHGGTTTWRRFFMSCTGWGWVSGSTTNWQFSSTAASTAWLRRTSPTTS